MQTVLAITLSLLPGNVQPDFVFLFTPFEYRYTGDGYQGQLFHYRLFIPQGGTTTNKFPLIVWLHGRGERGNDNSYHLRWLDELIFRPPWQRDRYPFYLLAVQVPYDDDTWVSGSPDQPGDDMIDVTAAILRRTLSDHQAIDPERVYLTGISTGGTGTWALAIRYPQYFAAVAPLASAGGDIEQVARISEIPIWAFHCSRDAGTSIEPDRAIVKALQDASGHAVLTEIDSASHDCWTAAFDDYHLLDWLMSQRRGKASSSPAPGTVSLIRRLEDAFKGWHWWQVLLQVGIPVGFLSVLVFVINQRRRRNLQARPAHVASIDIGE